MSDLQHAIPIVVKGNALYRGCERWLVKGISYLPYASDREPNGDKVLLDALAHDRLHELEADVFTLHDLGLNTISVRHLEPDTDHTAALKLLEREGIYVLVTIFDGLHKRRNRWPTEDKTTPEDYVRQHYNAETMISNLRLVEELADHPNVLGFVVSGSSMNTVRNTKAAEVLRACIRDTKAFLHARGKRAVPIGATMSDLASLRLPFLQYFSSGSPPECADFAAIDCYSWAGKSSFQISGWKNLVASVSKVTRMPLMLSAFGANITQPRLWDELLCLYSPDMTGVFSGGFAYTFFESGNGHGIVKTQEDGFRKPARDFDRFRKHFKIINCRAAKELFSQASDAEVPALELQNLPSDRWAAGPELSPFPGDWDRTIGDVVHARAPDSSDAIVLPYRPR
ncbi:1,3-beta-glucanosyltransferase [Recurvomyces mirabilis]|uniref:1,3-beta-glucanosyltransferase n=1 Tax=Recurvomyces mirabilis TaxID=574656 RepID=A0AAE0WXE3_9PEZI|nr:1,3-beta-glucanosyltransferase [Recurvomyces mirabilis]KAK5161817.1 hypothetical protein LTS14_000162 [Recurvomyces mirabilis]